MQKAQQDHITTINPENNLGKKIMRPGLWRSHKLNFYEKNKKSQKNGV
jgi:hypothetical protein